MWGPSRLSTHVGSLTPQRPCGVPAATPAKGVCRGRGKGDACSACAAPCMKEDDASSSAACPPPPGVQPGPW
eukprot:CAMPEP_0202896982 /NCGR_PEP_ID=MMETSP1392-20130828/5866_1 /ASSEMBLY_ACC=CAM_ASM_000868 /TAXON_ID=225041 /ORGANISM="Chlamydomonas chlamydogama, Strain SAG 11-48b" /LENGTH=71 /DNA_ID=CAMNT_0049582513 /DNA_START=976 /DNA_END=1191 /DNA_ORIENTATION=-